MAQLEKVFDLHSDGQYAAVQSTYEFTDGLHLYMSRSRSGSGTPHLVAENPDLAEEEDDEFNMSRKLFNKHPGDTHFVNRKYKVVPTYMGLVSSLTNCVTHQLFIRFMVFRL
ncbi:hypothetical protein GC194_00585 [bacterium]|nr:hypothetical protein [bacterium]